MTRFKVAEWRSSMFIAEIKVGGSNFFAKETTLGLSAKLNCIMGGRGSGKTTLLTLVQWALSDENELSRDIAVLIKTNLGSGVLQITFIDDGGAAFQLSRSWGTAPAIKDSAGNFVSLENFRKKFSVNFFAAGSIEKIGIEPRERLKLFDGYIGDEIETIKGKIQISISKLKQNEVALKELSRERFKFSEDLTNYSSLEEEIKKARADLVAADTDAGIKEKFEEETNLQSNRSTEQQYLESAKSALLRVAEDLQKFNASVRAADEYFRPETPSLNPIVQEFRAQSIAFIAEMGAVGGKAMENIRPLGVQLKNSQKTLGDEHQKAEAKFSEMKQAIAKHRDLFQRVNILAQRENAKKLADENLKKIQTQFDELSTARSAALVELQGHISARTSLRTKKAAEINGILGDKVKILIKDSALNENFQDILRNAITKNQMRTTTAEQTLFENSGPSEFVRFYRANDAEGLALKHEIAADRVKALFDCLKTSDAIFDLETCVCEDVPNFYLAVEDSGAHEVFKATEDLSMGQRCTAVLPIIFVITKFPLLIDQPEDNLDNRYITKSIHEIIREIKKKRQLIFVTHNPNIPVISDSEFNVFLSYSDQKSSAVARGAIADVKAHIVELLEGGADAFKQRKAFYGY